jgi:hypothetical protein
VFGLHPHRNCDGSGTVANFLAIGCIRQSPGVFNHHLLGLRDELFQFRSFFGRDSSLRVLVQQFIEPPLLGGC